MNVELHGGAIPAHETVQYLRRATAEAASAERALTSVAGGQFIEYADEVRTRPLATFRAHLAQADVAARAAASAGSEITPLAAQFTREGLQALESARGAADHVRLAQTDQIYVRYDFAGDFTYTQSSFTGVDDAMTAARDASVKFEAAARSMQQHTHPRGSVSGAGKLAVGLGALAVGAGAVLEHTGVIDVVR